MQLSDELLTELDDLRREGGRSRSEVIREAIELYLAGRRAQSVDAAVVAGYTRIPPDEDLGAAWAARASIGAEPVGARLVNRGEMWWYELPELGRRPGCILTRQAAIPVLNAVLIAPATSTIRDIPSEVRLGTDDGMPADCALSFDNLLTRAQGAACRAHLAVAGAATR